MTLLRIQRISLMAACLSVCGFFLSLTWLLWQQPNLLKHVDGTLSRFEAVESKAYATLSNVDKGTKEWSDSAKSQADAVTGVATEAQGTLRMASGTLQSLQTTATKLNDSADAISGATRAAQGTLSQATTDLQTLNESIAATKPLIQHSDAAVQQFNTLLASPDITTALHQAGETATNVAHMSNTASQLEDHFAKPYLFPSKNPFRRIWEESKPFIVTGAKVTGSLF